MEINKLFKKLPPEILLLIADFLLCKWAWSCCHAHVLRAFRSVEIDRIDFRGTGDKYKFVWLYARKEKIDKDDGFNHTSDGIRAFMPDESRRGLHLFSKNTMLSEGRYKLCSAAQNSIDIAEGYLQPDGVRFFKWIRTDKPYPSPEKKRKII